MARLWLGFTAGLAMLGCAVPAPQDEPLRVMSFNIRFGTANDGENRWTLRRDLVAGVMRDCDPAVAGLQEALRFQLDELREALPGYREIGVGRRDGREAGEYAAILYQHRRLEVVDQGSFWFSATPDVPGSVSWGNRVTRVCTWGRFRDRGDDAAFYVFNVHWDHASQASRERSAELLAARVASRAHPDDPVIVTGDFNAGETNPAMRRLSAAGLEDSYRLLHRERTTVGTFHRFSGTIDGEKIDGIWITPGWRVLAAEIVRTSRDGRYPSDHFPVTAVLGRPASGAASTE